MGQLGWLAKEMGCELGTEILLSTLETKLQVHSKPEVWSEQFSSFVKVVNTLQNVCGLVKC